jgi:hypothetical protein
MVQQRGRRRAATRLVGALAFVSCCASACSGDDAAEPTTVVTLVAAECQARQPSLRVDLIDQAIQAVEAELGGPQHYFEINATELLVNLFVALDDGTSVRPFVFLQGELNSTEPDTAQGNTFASDSLEFDPQKVTSCVADELPSSTASAFEIIAGPDGSISYSLVVDSSVGGQLVVAVNGEGRVLSVDPV